MESWDSNGNNKKQFKPQIRNGILLSTHRHCAGQNVDGELKLNFMHSDARSIDSDKHRCARVYIIRVYINA